MPWYYQNYPMAVDLAFLLLTTHSRVLANYVTLRSTTSGRAGGVETDNQGIPEIGLRISLNFLYLLYESGGAEPLNTLHL